MLNLDEYIKNGCNRESIDEQAFSVKARVALQLGRESISNSITAIIELVKNAYDADAETVKIRFHGIKEKGMKVENENDSLIIIEDDGNGMNKCKIRVKSHSNSGANRTVIPG